MENKLTNFVIQKPSTQKRVGQTFEKGINVKEELKQEAFHILDGNGLDIEKAHVKAHQRKTKSGKLVQVKEYEDKRQKKEDNKKTNKKLKVQIKAIYKNGEHFSIVENYDQLKKLKPGDKFIYEGNEATIKSQDSNGIKAVWHGWRGDRKIFIQREQEGEIKQGSLSKSILSDPLYFEKAIVHSHQRKSKSGKLSQVKEYEDSRHQQLLNDLWKIKEYHHKMANHHELMYGKNKYDNKEIAEHHSELVGQHYDLMKKYNNLYNDVFDTGLKIKKQQQALNELEGNKQSSKKEDNNKTKYLISSKGIKFKVGDKVKANAYGVELKTKIIGLRPRSNEVILEHRNTYIPVDKLEHFKKSISSDPLYFEKANFDTEQRRKLAKKGHALPDGSFPIRNTNDLKNAIHDLGRSKNYGIAKRWIIKRAKALGATDLLPDKWNVKKAKNDMYEEEDELKKGNKGTGSTNRVRSISDSGIYW